MTNVDKITSPEYLYGSGSGSLPEAVVAHILDASPDGILYLDADLRLVYVNSTAAKYLGVTAAALVGRELSKAVPLLSGYQVYAEFMRCMEERIALRFVHPSLHTPGRWIEHKAYPVNGGLVVYFLDVTQAQNPEQQLPQREVSSCALSLCSFSESAGVGFAEVDSTSGLIVWANRKYCELLGYAAPELLNQKSFLSLTHPEDRELHIKQLATLERGASSRSQFEQRFVRKNGSCLWAHVTVSIAAVPVGAPSRTVILIRDISQRKKAEEDLRQAVEELQQINDSAPVAIWVARDPLCQNVFGNVAAKKLLGLPLNANVATTLVRGERSGSEILRSADIDVYDSEGRRLSNSELPMQRAAALNVEVRDQILSLHLPNGRQVTMVGSAVPLRDDKGAVRGSVASFVDITARVKAEQALRESEEWMRLAVKASGIGHWTWNMESGKCSLDEVCANMLGVKAECNVGDVLATIDPEDRPSVEEQLNHSIATGHPYRAEFRVRSSGLKPQWLVGQGAAEKSADGRAVRMYGVNFDITERKETEALLRDADRRKDEFLATLAHELRNPLAPISNALQILPRVAQDPSQILSLRNIMLRQADQLKHLIDDLLDVSRISRGRIELRRARLELASVVDEAVESIRPFIEAGRHLLTITLPSEVILLDGDRGRLVQVIGNLLHNSVKYTSTGGRIQLSAIFDNGNAVFSVKDSGTGIPPQMLEQIFEPFRQVDQHLDRAQGGLGIGLTLVKTLVELHGDKVEARSAGLGFGSEFIVRLPAEEAPSFKSAQNSESLPATNHQGLSVQRRRILVIDDLKPSADTLAMMLEGLDQDVRVAYNGRSALAVLAEFKPDIVISDVAMPGMDGYILSQKIRGAVTDAPLLVALTGYGQKHDHRRALEAGFHHHLVKPVSLSSLQEILLELPREQYT